MDIWTKKKRNQKCQILCVGQLVDTETTAVFLQQINRLWLKIQPMEKERRQKAKQEQKRRWRRAKRDDEEYNNNNNKNRWTLNSTKQNNQLLYYILHNMIHVIIQLPLAIVQMCVAVCIQCSHFVFLSVECASFCSSFLFFFVIIVFVVVVVVDCAVVLSLIAVVYYFLLQFHWFAASLCANRIPAIICMLYVSFGVFFSASILACPIRILCPHWNVRSKQTEWRYSRVNVISVHLLCWHGTSDTR